MSLSDAEKEKIQETEAYKAEVCRALEKKDSSSPLSDFQKQALLLFIGFLLTTFAGGILTAYWKEKDAQNQQLYLARRHALDKAYSVIDATAKEVATTIAAADDILITYYGDEWSSTDIDERRQNWTRTSRNWRVSSEVLSAETAAIFNDKDIDSMFREILQKRVLLGNAIINLPRSKKEIEGDKQLKGELDTANHLRGEIIDTLHKCCAAMTELVNEGKIR